MAPVQSCDFLFFGMADVGVFLVVWRQMRSCRIPDFISTGLCWAGWLVMSYTITYLAGVGSGLYAHFACEENSFGALKTLMLLNKGAFPELTV
jgi:hypothetical protein